MRKGSKPSWIWTYRDELRDAIEKDTEIEVTTLD
jgi:hypothetical protein